jgi:hypothetical protein
MCFPTLFAAISAHALCYDTPRSAVDSLQANSSLSAGSESNGYRVAGIQSDPVLGQRWVTISSCNHPEWPAIAFPTTESISRKLPAQEKHSSLEAVRQIPVVHAGDVVRLWRQENILRIEIAGVSEESAGLGETVRVRLLRRNTDDQSVPEQFSGIVRGRSNVEMLP